MAKYCIICGEPLNEEGHCPNGHEFKKMCLNCRFCGRLDKNTDELVCLNEDNKKAAMDKMLELLSKEGGGYSVKKLEIEPVPLKKPSLKCGKWEVDKLRVSEHVFTLFK